MGCAMLLSCWLPRGFHLSVCLLVTLLSNTSGLAVPTHNTSDFESCLSCCPAAPASRSQHAVEQTLQPCAGCLAAWRASGSIRPLQASQHHIQTSASGRARGLRLRALCGGRAARPDLPPAPASHGEHRRRPNVSVGWILERRALVGAGASLMCFCTAWWGGGGQR